MVLLLIILWKSSPIFRLGTLEGQVLRVVWSTTLFYPTAPSAKSSAWVLRHSSKACVTSQASVASCREEMVAPYPYPSVKGQANRSFGTEWRVRWTFCITENRSIVWEGEAVFGCFPVWWETLLRCEMLPSSDKRRTWLDYCIHIHSLLPGKKRCIYYSICWYIQYDLLYTLNLYPAGHSPQDLSLRSKAAPVMGHRPPERRCHFSNQRRLKATGYPASWLAGMWTGSIINLMIWVEDHKQSCVCEIWWSSAGRRCSPRKWRAARARLLNFIGLILDSQGKLFWKIIGLCSNQRLSRIPSKSTTRRGMAIMVPLKLHETKHCANSDWFLFTFRQLFLGEAKALNNIRVLKQSTLSTI